MSSAAQPPPSRPPMVLQRLADIESQATKLAELINTTIEDAHLQPCKLKALLRFQDSIITHRERVKHNTDPPPNQPWYINAFKSISVWWDEHWGKVCTPLLVVCQTALSACLRTASFVRTHPEATLDALSQARLGIYTDGAFTAMSATSFLLKCWEMISKQSSKHNTTLTEDMGLKLLALFQSLETKVDTLGEKQVKLQESINNIVAPNHTIPMDKALRTGSYEQASCTGAVPDAGDMQPMEKGCGHPILPPNNRVVPAPDLGTSKADNVGRKPILGSLPTGQHGSVAATKHATTHACETSLPGVGLVGAEHMAAGPVEQHWLPLTTSLKGVQGKANTPAGSGLAGREAQAKKPNPGKAFLGAVEPDVLQQQPKVKGKQRGKENSPRGECRVNIRS